jgi:hypothetical protein
MEYGEPGVSTLSPAPPPCCQLSQFHQVLHELVSMDNVEGGVGESQLVDVPEEQAEIPQTPCAAAMVWVAATAAGAESMPTTQPSESRPARSTVIVPGPMPTSSSRCAGFSCGSRYAAEFSAVRQRCDRRTES